MLESERMPHNAGEKENNGQNLAPIWIELPDHVCQGDMQRLLKVSVGLAMSLPGWGPTLTTE